MVDAVDDELVGVFLLSELLWTVGVDAEGEGKDSFNLRSFKIEASRFRSHPAIQGDDVGNEELIDGFS
ncbi:MAG TPA: hypothetical protein PK909_01325 [Sphaerochaeta sp.]|jgi:hypothetical protein|nr:hypothetical protein [Sphaerochaeta sp.]HQB54088.1 hypothetical protein [Sphaerochaeta sp.]